MILQFMNISKRYGGVQALQSANLTLHGGQIHALLGGNGSGKSTLIKIAAGLVKQDEGQILLNDVKINNHSPATSKAMKIVATAQELSIFSNLTVEENLTLCKVPVCASGFVDRIEMHKQALEVLAKLGMEEDISTPVGELPINKQYMLEFAKAIYQDFDVMLIDEITSALYKENVETVRKVLNEYKTQGKIILFVSHRMSEIFSICDSVTVMRNGRVISSYSIPEVTIDILLSDMIGDTRKSAVYAAADPQNERAEGEESKGLLLSAKAIPIPSYSNTINLDIYKGQIIGVAGLQGHGQSDLVEALFGLRGSIEVEFDGRKTVIASPQAAVKLGFAYVSGNRERDGSFQQHSLADNIRVTNDLIFHRKSNATEALDTFGIKYDHALQKITALSGGNQQKVIFGRWIITSPKLLLTNDPSKGIDVNARAELREIMWNLTKQGMSIVFVSSDEDELVSLCAPITNAQIIVMYEGNIVQTLRGKEITRDRLIAATLVKEGVHVE